MGGASSKEVKRGTAVTGKYCKKVEMPPGVIGEQMPGGMRPGAKLRAFTPTLLAEMLQTKGAAALYEEFQTEVSQDCGGENIKGWNSAAIQQKVTKFQPRFNELGIRVTYHMAQWQQWVSNGQYGGTMQTFYKYWMTYAEMDVPVVTLQADAYAPEQDGAKADGVVLATGSPLTSEAGKLAPFEPVGHWTLDVDAQGQSVALKEGSMDISRADGRSLRAVGSALFPILCFSKTVTWDVSLEGSGTNVFVGSTDGGATAIELALISDTSLKVSSASRHGTYQFLYHKQAEQKVDAK